jgi:hypothetical protein
MRIRPLSILVFIAVAISFVATAQQPEQQPEKKSAGSTVTGHVYLADTNTPARLATVMLEPAGALDNEPEPPSAGR